MSRIRSVYPGQWTDEDFVAMSAFARLLALAVRNEADDNGVFEWKPAELKMRLFPADNPDVAALLDELEEHRHVASYKANGRRYGIIRNFARWQKPRRPSVLYPLPATGEVHEDFLIAAEPSIQPTADLRQPRFEFEPDQEPEVRPETGFPTSADIVRPYRSEDEDIVQENPIPIATSESKPRARVENRNKGDPVGRCAPSPWLKDRKKNQLLQKLFRFCNASLSGDDQLAAITGLTGLDDRGTQWWIDTLDQRMRREKWDDMREWKRRNLSGAAA